MIYFDMYFIHLFSSDAYTVSNIRYYWKADDPVEVSDSVEMPQFEPERHFQTSDCTRNYTGSKYLQK